jgi:hypothetical protein
MQQAMPALDRIDRERERLNALHDAIAIIVAEIGQRDLALSQEVEKAGGQSKWARANGVNRSTVAQVLIGRRDPGPKLLRALKIRLQWTSPQ